MSVNFGGFSFDPENGSVNFGGQAYRKTNNKPRRVIGTPLTRLLLSLAVTFVVGLIYFYFELPALNLHDRGLYVLAVLLCAVFCVMQIILSGFSGQGAGGYFHYVKDRLKAPAIIALAFVAVALVGSVSGWVVFRADDYSRLLEVSEGDFASEVQEISWDHIPMLDSTSANVLANRKLGELSDLVSQFEVSSASAQINLCNTPVRVNYLNYGDFFKWLNNHKNGIPAYLVIDMVTQEVTVERLEKGIRYSPSEYFFRNIDRYLRFKFPTMIFDDVNFEVDEEGQPYWVASVMTKTIGLFGGTDLEGAVLVNAVTGECVYHEIGDVPSWVDRVYPADLLIQQYDYYGVYHNGFWNSMFGQRDCTVTTDGYNYIAQNDDVWLYTGVTSVGGDESNVGFILVNQRTKDASFYSCAGAEEFSAMNSAEGAVQQYAYDATFPLLMNISGQPTYFMALKDSSSLVKMYAMVNVQQYQIVATGYSVEETQENYVNLLMDSGIVEDSGINLPLSGVYETVSGKITDIRTSVIEGNSWYYVNLDHGDAYYAISAAQQPDVVILNLGDSVEITFSPGDESILQASSVTKAD